MLGVDKAGDAVPLLNLGDHVQSYRGLTARLRSVDLYDTSLRDSAESERDIKA